MTSQPEKQIIIIHIFPNISKSKDNETTKFDQLKEYNVRNVFLQTSCRKKGRETSSRPPF